jgi:FkbM family methyltransferase
MPSTFLANLKRLPEIFTCMKEASRWWPLTLAYLGIRPLAYPFEVLLRSGEVLVLSERTDLIIFWLIFVRRHYPVRTSDRVIVDVGANVGLFTLYAAREAPAARIVSIEPFPDTCQRLSDLVNTNRLGGRVTILNWAISGSSGIAAMDAASGIPSQYKRIYSEATRALNPRHRGKAALAQPDAGVAVRAETLDEILKTLKGAPADLVKMNIHGSEYEVLMSSPPSTLQQFHRIVVQYHDLPAEVGIGKRDLFEHLERNGFRLVSDEDTGRGSGLAVFSLANEFGDADISDPQAGAS